VRPGAVFVAMKGGSTDGNRYVEKAHAGRPITGASIT
jgi:UDP-N-acetylmuramyl pentapeptide synthase